MDIVYMVLVGPQGSMRGVGVVVALCSRPYSCLIVPGLFLRTSTLA